MNKLAIVGTHSATRDQGPFDDLTYDIWVFNEAPQADWCKRWDAVFQMHKPEVYTSPNNFVNKGHWDWLQQDHGIAKTVYMQEIDERVPNSARYPLEEIRQALPAARYGQLTSTVSMAIALGLYLGYERIELWGVDLSSNTEYAYQQPGFVFWVGVASALLGPDFIPHSGLQHFSTRVYGYEGETQIEREYFEMRRDWAKAEVEGQQSIYKRAKDRIDACLLDFKPADFPKAILDYQQAALDLGEARGILQEAERYATKEDPTPRQQFERRGAIGHNEGETFQIKMYKLLGTIEYVFNSWAITRNYEALKQLRMFISQFVETSIAAGGNIGVMNENARYMAEYDQRVQAAGGQRTLAAVGA